MKLLAPKPLSEFSPEEYYQYVQSLNNPDALKKVRGKKISSEGGTKVDLAPKRCLLF